MIPQKGKRECWRVVLKSRSAEPKQFDLYVFADLGARIGEHMACTYGDFDNDLSGVYFCHKAYDNPTEYHVVHLASDFDVKAYMCGCDQQNVYKFRVFGCSEADDR